MEEAVTAPAEGRAAQPQECQAEAVGTASAVLEATALVERGVAERAAAEAVAAAPGVVAMAAVVMAAA